MPYRPPVRCTNTECRALHYGTGRCPRCQPARGGQYTTAIRDAAEIKRRKETVDLWRLTYGDWCPGYGIPGHEATDLTADHVLGAQQGRDQPLQVLCRSCNGSKQNRVDTPAPSKSI